MLDFQQKRKVRSLMYNRITLYVLLTLILIVLHSTWSVYQKKKESEELKNIALQNTEELRARDADLKSKMQRLDTDSGVEEEIRSKFSVAKENEAMVIVVADSGESTTTNKHNPPSIWGVIKSWFGLGK